MIKFLPSYVGSKAYWVQYLQEYKGEDFVELFCGSAVLSANLAKTAILNDIDSQVFNILMYFNDLIVPEIFTCSDFQRFKGHKEWWKFAYCLQKMAFSGVFRYSKNGYNVPIKKRDGEPAIKEVRVQPEYDEAVKRWEELYPIVCNVSYERIPIDSLIDKVVVLDPPYEDSQASYNGSFDYETYWQYVEKIKKVAKVIIIFDRQKNLLAHGVPVIGTRKMRVNGGREGDIEAMGIYENNKWRTKTMENNNQQTVVTQTTTQVQTESAQTAVKRGRGRPKGSKNKPKAQVQA